MKIAAFPRIGNSRSVTYGVLGTILSGVMLYSFAIAITDVCDITVLSMYLRLTNRIIMYVIIFTVKLIVGLYALNTWCKIYLIYVFNIILK